MLGALYGRLRRIRASVLSGRVLEILRRVIWWNDGRIVSCICQRTSFAESFGYAVVEASMCGLPVVAYNVGALCEHSLQKYFLIDVGDIKAMAAQILNITNKEQ